MIRRTRPAQFVFIQIPIELHRRLIASEITASPLTLPTANPANTATARGDGTFAF